MGRERTRTTTGVELGEEPGEGTKEEAGNPTVTEESLKEEDAEAEGLHNACKKTIDLLGLRRSLRDHGVEAEGEGEEAEGAAEEEG